MTATAALLTLRSIQALLLLQLVGFGLADESFYLSPPPGKAIGPDIALILIQGASSPPNAYRAVAKAIQAASPLPIWVGVPQFLLDTPEPFRFDAKLREIRRVMEAAGMVANHTVILAHSLGGIFAQQHVVDKGGIDALVLYGATILRKYRRHSQLNTTLTLDGDLDGLLRISRQAEAWFHQTRDASTSRVGDALPTQPVVLLEGLNHWSIASGPPPPNVREHDLPANITEGGGHAAIATAVSRYISALWDSSIERRANAIDATRAALAHTANLVAPIVDALALEGSRRLHPPCDSDYPTNPACKYPKYPDAGVLPPKGPPSPMPPMDCTCGSKWVQGHAQPMMAALDETATPGVHLDSRDAFHDVSDVRPFHLPHIFAPPPGASCTSSPCVITSTSVTMPIYDPADALDTGLAPLSAIELRAKLKSRQAMRQKAGMRHVDFQASDANNTRACADINQAAYEWALRRASPTARARFLVHGTPLLFGDDTWSGIGITGPKWIHDPLRFARTSNGSSVLVTAPTFATPNKNLGDEPFLLTVGYHYCKLLSPARALEWIYVDGLRAEDASDDLHALEAEEEREAPAATLMEESAAGASDAPCCKACEPPRSKYYSVDAPHGFCGEACMRPALFPVFKLFEKNLTDAGGRNASACAMQLSPDDRHYTVYNGTVTHGVPGLSITLDLYAPGPKEVKL